MFRTPSYDVLRAQNGPLMPWRLRGREEKTFHISLLIRKWPHVNMFETSSQALNLL
jgi:hypothetical protein